MKLDKESGEIICPKCNGQVILNLLIEIYLVYVINVMERKN